MEEVDVEATDHLVELMVYGLQGLTVAFQRVHEVRIAVAQARGHHPTGYSLKDGAPFRNVGAFVRGPKEEDAIC